MSALNSRFKWCAVISVAVTVTFSVTVTVNVTVSVAVVVGESWWEWPVRAPSLLVSLVLCLVIAVCYVYPIVLQFVYSLFTFYLDVFFIIIISIHRFCCCFRFSCIFCLTNISQKKFLQNFGLLITDSVSNIYVYMYV